MSTLVSISQHSESCRTVANMDRFKCKHVVLISCSSRKRGSKALAKHLYNSQLFRKQLEYAQKLNPDLIFILSAEYGLLELDREIEPYDKSLKKMPAKEARAWAERILEDLRMRADLTRDRFTLLAGDRYRRYLLDHLVHWEAPLTGLRIGEQLQRLRKLCRE